MRNIPHDLTRYSNELFGVIFSSTCRIFRKATVHITFKLRKIFRGVQSSMEKIDMQYVLHILT